MHGRTMARKRTTTPVVPDDPRSHRSIEALKVALLALIEVRPFERISIKDITDTAGLSYQTFFRRFGGKDELLREIASEEVARVLSLGHAAIEQRIGHETGRAFCERVQRHRPLWTALLAGGAASFVREEFLRVAKQVAREHPRVNPAIPLDLAAAVATSGMFEILTWWMRQPDDYPIENVVTLFDALVVDSIGRPRDLRTIR